MTLLYANLKPANSHAREKFDLYVVHNHNLHSRRKYIESRIPAAKFVQIELDAPELLGKYYLGHNPASWNKKCLNLWTPIPASRALTSGEIACTVSHFYAYEKFLKDSSEEFLVVLEDDAVFSEDFTVDIGSCLNSVPEKVEAIFIGGGYDHSICYTLGTYKNFLIKHHPATNTTIGYILKRSMVKKIMAQFTQFDLPIDYELAHLLMVNNALVFHVNPYLVEEGSKNGRYESSIGAR